jgi:hypothetical protein
MDKAEVRKLWVEELRSGNWKQGRSLLGYRDEDAETGERGERYCCLGVLCELYRKHEDPEGKLLNRYYNNDEQRYEYYDNTENEEDHNYLPMVVQRWAGLKTSQGVAVDGDSGRAQSAIYYAKGGRDSRYKISLADANDDGATFEQIAENIERNANLLFTE